MRRRRPRERDSSQNVEDLVLKVFFVYDGVEYDEGKDKGLINHDCWD